MKKGLFILCVLSILFLLTSCSSGISQDEYDTLKKECSSLSSQLSESIKDRNEFEKKYIEENKKYVDLNTQNGIATYAKIWANAAFEDSRTSSVSVALVSDGYLEIIVCTNDDPSSEMVTFWYDKVITSMSTLSFMCEEHPEYMNFERIGISILDSSDSEVFEIELSDVGSPDFACTATTIRMVDMEEIYKGLSNTTKN